MIHKFADASCIFCIHYRQFYIILNQKSIKNQFQKRFFFRQSVSVGGSRARIRGAHQHEYQFSKSERNKNAIVYKNFINDFFLDIFTF